MADKHWLIMMDWIEERIQYVVKENKHKWPTDLNYDMCKWALAVENHDKTREIDHWSEPPIPPVIGYVAQIVSSPENASDPIPLLGQIESEMIGNTAIALRNDPQPSKKPNYKPAAFDPTKLLAEWISGRIKYAADDMKRWSSELTNWTNCIKAIDPKKRHLEPPTRLVLGYIVHAACYHESVPNPSDQPGTDSCEFMGAVIAALDLRTEPWNQCAGTGSNQAQTLEHNLGHVKVPQKDKAPNK